LFLKVCAVQGLVSISGDDHEALVPLASSGALAKGTGGVVITLIQGWVWMMLWLLAQQRYPTVLEVVVCD